MGEMDCGISEDGGEWVGNGVYGKGERREGERGIGESGMEMDRRTEGGRRDGRLGFIFWGSNVETGDDAVVCYRKVISSKPLPSFSRNRKRGGKVHGETE